MFESINKTARKGGLVDGRQLCKDYPWQTSCRGDYDWILTNPIFIVKGLDRADLFAKIEAALALV